MAEDWKEKIIQEKLGGKKDWTEEERAELCRQLDQDLDKHIDSLSKTNREGAWTEENWKEQMAEHPLFAPYLQDEGVTEGEAPINPLSEGLAQLKFDPDHNSPEEVAQSYKEEGNLQFKFKKFRLAVANFTEGIKQKCKDNELNAQLYNNRSAANFHLGNYRSSLNDCQKAFELKPDYMKAVLRATECTTKLQRWDEVIAWCDRGLRLDADNQKLRKVRQDALKEKSVHERDQRKKAAEEKRKQGKEEALVSTIRGRGVRLAGGHDSLNPTHPAAQDFHVHLNEGGELVWPVGMVYPEYKEFDIIQQFNENDRIIDHLEVMFGEDVPPAPWDTKMKYKLQNLQVYFEDKGNSKLIKVNPYDPLGQVLADPRYEVLDGTPMLIILAEGKFLQSFLDRYK